MTDISEETQLETYREQARTAAEELGYKQKYIERIDAAVTINEITNIMVTARRDRFGR